MQALRLYLIDVGYGRGYLDAAGRTASLEAAQEFPWGDALSLVRQLRKRGYTGAEAVPVTVVPATTLTEVCDGVAT